MILQRNIRIVFLFIFLFIIPLSGCSPSVSPKARKESSSRAALAASLLQDGNYGEALRNAKKAVELDPENIDARLTLATVYAARNELDKAEKELKKVLEMDKDNPYALNTLGVVYIHKGRFREAVELLKRAAHNELYIGRHLAYGNLGWAYIEMGEYSKAIIALKNALREQPKFCVARYRLAQAYYKLKDYQRALEEIKMAIKPFDSNQKIPDCSRLPDCYYLMGLIYISLEKIKEAEQSFKKCVELASGTEIGERCKTYLSDK